MKSRVSFESFIERLPKAELHLHIEGTFEPKLMFAIARRNNIELGYDLVRDILAAYNFKNLQEFLEVYYKGVNVLLQEQDFYDLTMAYLEKAYIQNILHTEIFFDPQAHTRRGVDFHTVVKGIHRALADAKEKLGISSGLIMCFLRDKDPSSAMESLEEALSYKNWIVGVGLDSYEIGFPPSKFQTVFERALDEGFLAVAHAGEEGPADYIWQAISLLRVSRVDHGISSLEDETLTQELIRRKIPLTVCPLSNLKLGVVEKMKDHPLKKMMRKGLLVTLNSDDPAYFGGYLNENYLIVQKVLQLNKRDIYTLASNSFEASFMNKQTKARMIKKLNDYFIRVGS